MPQTRLKCHRCGNPLSDARVKARKRNCMPCERLNKKEQAEAAHEKRVCETYGLQPGDYDKLFEAQGGKCAIAKCHAKGLYIRLAVEHNHKCDKGHDPKNGCRFCVRGLVCKSHNKWIGWAGDDPEVFYSLADYLRNPPAQRILTDDK